MDVTVSTIDQYYRYRVPNPVAASRTRHDWCLVESDVLPFQPYPRPLEMVTDHRRVDEGDYQEVINPVDGGDYGDDAAGVKHRRPSGEVRPDPTPRASGILPAGNGQIEVGSSSNIYFPVVSAVETGGSTAADTVFPKVTRAFILGKEERVHRMADLIVKAAVKEALDDKNVASDFYEALDEEVDELLEDAARRAEANDRKTVQPRDL